MVTGKLGIIVPKKGHIVSPRLRNECELGLAAENADHLLFTQSSDAVDIFALPRSSMETA